MQPPLRRRLLSGSEEIPTWVGLSLGVLFLASVAAIGGAALYVQKQELCREQIEGAARWTDCLARHVAYVKRESPESIAPELRRAGRQDNIPWCAVVSTAGLYTAHFDPDLTGQRAERLSAENTALPGVQIASDPANPAGKILIARIVGADLQPGADELRVAFTPPPFIWTRSEILIWSGYVLPVVLGLYLVCYRLFRRAVQPLAAIRRRLVHCEDVTAGQLAALRLNDSFDQVSGSWNRLIDFVSEIQDQLRRGKLNTDMTAAMDAFRSERLTNILMQLPFGAMVVAADGTVVFMNRTAAGMMGAAGEAADGGPPAGLLDESLRVSLLSGPSAQKPAPPGMGRWIDHTFKRPHGDVTIRFWSMPSELGDEHFLFMQDVTQAKETERARDHFLYHVTHELRTPLTNIRAYAETLSQGVIDDPQTVRECYNVIMGETQRLNRLVEDILNVSQLEVGSARLNLSDLAVDTLLRKTVQDMQGSADAKRLDLVLSLPAKSPRVRGDRERLAVVLVNLLGNAIKYTPEGGRIEIECIPENERVRINVTDTGMGIAPEHQEKIFEKFYRVTDERVQGIPGTGLGLAIVRETVRLHGGGIFVTSTPGKGSTFSLVLPAQPLDGGGAEPALRPNTPVEKK